MTDDGIRPATEWVIAFGEGNNFHGLRRMTKEEAERIAAAFAARWLDSRPHIAYVPTAGRQSWHCVTDGVTYPGCGRCGPCISAAPRMFDELRRWEAAND
jgi:hypothetical protein